MLPRSDLEFEDNGFAVLVEVFGIGFDPLKGCVIGPRRDP
jgi:hypothetical protein